MLVREETPLFTCNFDVPDASPQGKLLSNTDTKSSIIQAVSVQLHFVDNFRHLLHSEPMYNAHLVCTKNLKGSTEHTSR